MSGQIGMVPYLHFHMWAPRRSQRFFASINKTLSLGLREVYVGHVGDNVFVYMKRHLRKNLKYLLFIHFL